MEFKHNLPLCYRDRVDLYILGIFISYVPITNICFINLLLSCKKIVIMCLTRNLNIALVKENFVSLIFFFFCFLSYCCLFSHFSDFLLPLLTIMIKDYCTKHFAGLESSREWHMEFLDITSVYCLYLIPSPHNTPRIGRLICDWMNIYPSLLGCF